MKFIHHLSLVALFGSFAVAVPANFLSLTLSLKEGDAVTHERGKPKCALGLYALYRGEDPDTDPGACWTCCVCSSAPERDDTAESPALAVQTEAGNLKESPALVTQRKKDVAKRDEHSSNVDICWRICGFKPLDCPEKWYGWKTGGCYTCCKCSSAPWNSDASPADKVSLPAAHKENKLGL